MLEAFGEFRNTPPRVTDDVRAGRTISGWAARTAQVKSQYR